jgi:beta-lactamase superfamily II metal-dependent hydrolase
MMLSMEHDSNWFAQEDVAERLHRRKSRIFLIAALLVALSVILTVLLLARRASVGAEPSLAEATASPAIVIPASPVSQSIAREAAGAGLMIAFLVVGQGDSIFLQSPSGKTMLVDGGPESAFETVSGYLDAHGVVGLDVVVASHLHADHIGG